MAASKTISSSQLAAMSASDRLAFYREAAKSVKPVEPSISFAERAAITAAAAANFGTDFKAAYRFHRVQ